MITINHKYNKKKVIIIYRMRTFIRNNITLVSIIIFLVIFGLIQMYRPGFLYNRDGSIREFGVGYKNKTILPLWLLSLILGILSYLLVMYYLTYPKYL
jgi:hypothetical protein